MKKRLVFLVLMMMVMTVVLCACGEKNEQEQKNSSEVEETNVNINEEEQGEIVEIRPATQEEIDKLIVALNDGSFKIKEKFSDVKDRMGAEAKPSQTYTPCGGSDDEQVTTHYYDGLKVEETHEGYIYNVVISGFDYPESKATIAGIKLGDTPDTVKQVMGVEPDTDSEYTINYVFGDIYVSFGLDFGGTGNVNYISMFDSSSGMV